MRSAPRRDAAPLSRIQKLRLAAEILQAYVAVRWSLRRSGLPETLAAVRRPAGGVARLETDVPLAEAMRLGRVVQRSLRLLPFDSRCLIRSLVVTRLLARRGLESTLVLGARSKPGFAAHSWVEYAGVPLLPTGTGFHRLTEM